MLPLLSLNGSNLTEDQGRLKKHWAEHFSNLLNRLSTIDHDVLQLPILYALDLPPSADEIRKLADELK